jgi:Flp pilus assembly secretin CpaC
VEDAKMRRVTTAMYLMTGIAAAVLPAPLLAEPPVSAAATAGVAPPTVAVRRELERRAVELTTDTALALESDEPFTELSIANPEIADISTISNNSLYLLGKRPGRTTLMLMGDGGQVLSIIDVQVSPDISEFRARLADILPGEEIEAFTANDGIVLTGRVGSQAQIDRALALASHYAPGRISNLITIVAAEIAAPDLSDFEVRLRDLLPGEEIEVSLVNDGIVLSGEVGSTSARDNALALAERFAPGRVTSLLAIRAAAAVVPDAAEVGRHLAQILPREDIHVHVLGDTLVLSGRATSAEAAERAVEVATLASGGVRISNLITVDVSADCTVRTRRGGEIVETTIPCREKKASAPAATPVETAFAAPRAGGEAGLPRPKPRPLRLSVN